MCLSFVAGFIGHRLLPLVASGLEKKVADAINKSQQAQQEARQATKRIEREGKVDEAVDAAFTDLQQSEAEDVELPPEIVQAHIEHLEALSPQNPTRRRLHFVLGRLYRRQKKYDKAVAVLSYFIDSKKQHSEGSDDHTAAALYNRARYQSLMSEELKDHGDEHKATEMREAAIDDLKACFKLDPASVASAKRDRDLSPLKDAFGWQ